MYVCLECYEPFEEPKRCYGELLEHFGTPCREEWNGSLCCGSAYAEAQRCALCDEYITEDYYKDENGNRYCESHFTKYELGEELS